MRLHPSKLLLAIGAALLVALVPALAFAEGGEGGNTEMLTTAAFQLANLLLLFGLGYYFGRQPFSKFLTERKEKVTRELDEARKLHDEARVALSNYREKLDQLDTERKSILDEYRVMGEKERDRIIEEARGQANKIARDARLTIDSEVNRARTALEAEVIHLASSMAEASLREQLDKKKQKALVDAYLVDLERQFESTSPGR